MGKTLVALYRNPATAQQVVEALLDAGFSGDDISLLVSDATGWLNAPAQEISAGEGAGFGALIGALIGIGTALVPGIGPLITGGVLGVAITAGVGAAAGAVTGGISAALLDLGMSDEEADFYVSGLRGGGTIVSVTTKAEWIEWAQRIMSRHQPIRIEEREAKWYTDAWGSAYNEGYPASEIVSADEPTRRSMRIERAKTRARVYEYRN